MPLARLNVMVGVAKLDGSPRAMPDFTPLIAAARAPLSTRSQRFQPSLPSRSWRQEQRLEQGVSQALRRNVRAAARRNRAPTPRPATLPIDLPVARATGEAPVAAAPPPIVLRHLAPAKVSEVYESYWRFAAERQAVFFRRARGETRPWTDNPVLAIYKFTNAYRASDRVSQYLIRHVIYRDDLPKSPREVFFRILLFKLFNKIETWELLERVARPDHVRGLSLRAV